MILEIAKLQADSSKFKPTQNPDTNFEMGENKVCISGELYTLLVIMKGKSVRLEGYDYFLINEEYPIILRKKVPL